MSQVDAAGNWVNATTEVKEVEKTCINNAIIITPGTMQVTTSRAASVTHAEFQHFHFPVRPAWPALQSPHQKHNQKIK